MAPKRQVEKVEAKQVLTAVLLADSFTQVRACVMSCTAASRIFKLVIEHI